MEKYFWFKYTKGKLKGCLNPTKSHLLFEGMIKVTTNRYPFDSIVLHIEEKINYFVIDYKQVTIKEYDKWDRQKVD